MNGGEGGIRTHGGLAPTAVFKTAALNHSATSPRMSVYRTQGLRISLKPQMCKRQLKRRASTRRLVDVRKGQDDFRSALDQRHSVRPNRHRFMVKGISVCA